MIKMVDLDSIAEIVRGVTFSKADGTSTPEDGRLPVIRAGSIQSTLLVNEGQIWVPKEKVKSHQMIKKNDIIMCTSSGSASLVGKCAIASEDWTGSFGAFCAGIRVDEKLCIPSYLYYFLSSPTFRNWSGASDGANIKNIRASELAKFQIPLPPLETQKKIAAVLEKADQLRKDCLQMEQELNSLAQSVFIDMFGDPVTNPKGWDKHELSKVLSVNHGYAFKSEYFTSEGDYVLLTPGNFKEEGGYWDRGEKQKYYSGEIPSRYILEKNDLLLAMTEQAAGLLGSSILVPESNKYLHNQRLGLVKFKNAGQNTVFYSYLFNNKSVRLAIHSSSTGTKVKHTSPTKLESIKVGVPPSSLQKEFELIIKTIEQNIALNNKAKDDYEQSFNALMQKAFKGELNL